MKIERGFLLDLAKAVILGFVLSLVFKTFFGFASIVGHSMDPTLNNGETKLINKMVYFTKGPERGDIIIFYPSTIDNSTYVKRVIAIPGDTISIKDHQVYLNGEVLSEPYIFEKMETERMKEIELLPGEYFVMGDNRNHSSDSRQIGVIRTEDIIGKLYMN